VLVLEQRKRHRTSTGAGWKITGPNGNNLLSSGRGGTVSITHHAHRRCAWGPAVTADRRARSSPGPHRSPWAACGTLAGCWRAR
jgi:hypothetical protein